MTTGSPTRSDQTGNDTHGLNGDILVWNHVTKRRHELTSMGIRVNAQTLKKQLELSHQLDFMKLPYHQAILNNRDSAFDRRWNRTVAYPDAAAKEGASRRG